MSIPKKSKQTAKKTSKVKAPAKKTAKAKGAATKTSKRPVKAAAKTSTKKAPRASTGTKRSAEELTKLKSNIVFEVTTSAGLTTEQIAKNLGTTTKALAMPLRQLRATKALSTSGTRRFLRYFPKGQAPKESARKKAT